MSTFVGDDMCGDRSGARLTLILMIVFTVVGTLIAALWFAEVEPFRLDLDPDGADVPFDPPARGA